MTIAPIVLKGRVVAIHDATCWSDAQRRVIIHPDGQDNLSVLMIESDRLLLKESVTITITPDNPSYGSQVLKDIQEKAGVKK